MAWVAVGLAEQSDISDSLGPAKEDELLSMDIEDDGAVGPAMIPQPSVD